MKTIEVKFLDSYYGNTNKSYHYLIEDNEIVQAGDHAIVHNGSEIKVVKIIAITHGTSSKATKTVVSLITDETMKDYRDRNSKIAERKQLLSRLEHLLSEQNEMLKYKLLAEHSSEAAEILRKLDINI